jgi:excisionase family DNA binding protein
VSANYSKKDAANILGVSTRTLDNLISNRKIEHVRIGRRMLFTPDQINRFIEENTVKAFHPQSVLM